MFISGLWSENLTLVAASQEAGGQVLCHRLCLFSPYYFDILVTGHTALIPDIQQVKG